MMSYYGCRKERRRFRKEWKVDPEQTPIVYVDNKIYNDLKDRKRETIIVEKNTKGNAFFQEVMTNAIGHNNLRTLLVSNLNFVEHEINEFARIGNRKTEEKVLVQITAIDEYKRKIELFFDYAVI